jgi:WD40 repeat protein
MVNIRPNLSCIQSARMGNYAIRGDVGNMVIVTVILFLSSLGVVQAPALEAQLDRTFSSAAAQQGRGVAFSPDGQVLAAANVDGALRLWRAADGQLLQVFVHPSGVTSVAFSPDGAWLVSGSYDGGVRFWRVKGGALTRTLKVEGTVWSVTVSPDGQRVAASGEDKMVHIWRVSDGVPLRALAGHALNVWHLAFSPDGRRLASGSFDKTAKIWDVESGALLHTLTGHSQAVVGIAWSATGDRIATSGDDATVRLWRAADGAAERVLTGGADHVYAVAFSADGEWLAGAGRGQGGIATLWKQIAGYRWSPRGTPVRLWRVRDGALQQTLTGHDDDVMGVAFSPDTRWLATSSEDRTVKLWRLQIRK